MKLREMNLIISEGIFISLFIIQTFFTWTLRYLIFSRLNTGLEKMPASRKSWIPTANFWNKPRIGSFIQKISSNSISCCYFKNNLHPFKWLKSSVRKQSSSVQMAEVICLKKINHSIEQLRLSIKKSHPFEWLSSKKIIINSKIPCL